MVMAGSIGGGARQGEEGEDQQEAEEGEEGEQEGEEEEGQGSHPGQNHRVTLRGDDPQRDHQAVPQGEGESDCFFIK